MATSESSEDSDLDDFEDFEDEMDDVSQEGHGLEQGDPVKAIALNETPLDVDMSQAATLGGSEEGSSNGGASGAHPGDMNNRPGFDDNGEINMGGSSIPGKNNMGVNDGMAFEHQETRHVHAPPMYVDAPPAPLAEAPPGHAWMLTRPQWVLAPIGLPGEVPIDPMQYDSQRAAAHSPETHTEPGNVRSEPLEGPHGAMQDGVVDRVTYGQPPCSTLPVTSPRVKSEDADDSHGFGDLYGAEDDRPRRRHLPVESQHVKSEH